MERQPVASSNIKSVGYDEGTMILEIEFHSNEVYQYFGVSEATFSGLICAFSKGTYLNEYIKGRYQYRRVR